MIFKYEHKIISKTRMLDHDSVAHSVCAATVPRRKEATLLIPRYVHYIFYSLRLIVVYSV